MSIAQHHRRHSSPGFSLVELMIVVALAALVMLLAIPNVIARLPVYRLDSAVDRINAQLHVARMEAMTEGQYRGIRFLGSTKSYDLWSTSIRNGPPADSLSRFNLNDLPGVAFQTHPTEGHFGPGGTFTAQNSYGNMLWIWVYSDDTREQRSIVVWPSGQVSVYRYTGGSGA